MGKKEIQRLIREEYSHFIEELKSKLQLIYGQNIFLLTNYGFCYGNINEHKNIVTFEKRYNLFDFIHECLKKDKYQDIIRLHNEFEVEEFIEHIKKFVTDGRYSQEFDNLIHKYVCFHHDVKSPSIQSPIRSSQEDLELSNKCKSISFVHDNVNETDPSIGSRAEIADNTVASDQNLASISIMPITLLILTIISIAFYYICGKLRSVYKNEDQQLPTSELTEGDSGHLAVRYRTARY